MKALLVQVDEENVIHLIPAGDSDARSMSIPDSFFAYYEEVRTQWEKIQERLYREYYTSGNKVLNRTKFKAPEEE